MSAGAQANGWRGFDGIGEKVDRGGFGHPPKTSGWLYRCDGMPRLMGCGAEVVVTRRWTRVGAKGQGWLVCYGLESIDSSKPIDDPANLYEDHDVVLTFCPACAAVVREQDAARERKRVST